MQGAFSIFGKHRRAAEAARRDNARLLALLAAAPAAWCSLDGDGLSGMSPGFAPLLGKAKVARLEDIAEALDPTSAAALHGCHDRLVEKSEAFAFDAATADGARRLRIIGRSAGENGQALNALYVIDISRDAGKLAGLEEKLGLAEAERNRLAAALDGLPIPVWVRGRDLSLIWCNRAYAAALDCDRDTVVAEQREFSRAQSRPLAIKAQEMGEISVERSHVVLAGNRHLFELTETPVGKGFIGYGVDLTRAEELQSDLSRHVAAQGAILEQLGSAIAIFGADTRLSFCNNAFLQLWGLEEAWCNAGPTLGELMELLRERRRLPEQANWPRFKQGWLGMFTGLLDPHEEMLHSPDGAALRMLVVPHPLGGLMFTFEDVTARLDLESSYNTLIAVQRETIDHLAEGIAVFGGDGRIKLWNPAFRRIWGLEDEQILAEPHVAQLVERLRHFYADRPDWGQVRGDMSQLVFAREARQGKSARADGSVLEYTTVPLPDGDVMISMVDITASVRVEQALREKAAALEAAERLKLDFLANVSYQLRTPLSTIMGFAEMLDAQYFGPLNDKQREYAVGIHEAGETLLALVNDILDLSTIEAGYLTLEKGQVDIATMLTSVADLAREWARKHKLNLDLDLPQGIGALNGDERRLKQALVNLINNAINFTPEGGRITLAARRAEGGVNLIVRDTGVGIEQADQERVFESFERVERARHRAGAGLGLPLVRRILELHQGRVELASEPGKGTEITCFVPDVA